MRAVVTGASGFLGVHLVEELLKSGWEVTAVIRHDSPNRSRLNNKNGLTVLELDISEISQLTQMTEGTYDAFFHLAWEGIRGSARNDRQLQQRNLINSKAAADTAKKLRCSTFVTSGSQAECGITSGAITEESLLQPVCEYGKAKAEFLSFASDFCAENGIRLIWARIFSLYGRYDYSGSLISRTIALMSENKPIEMSEGTQIWNYMNVCDAAMAINAVVSSDFSGIINIADIDSRPLKEYIIEIKSIADSQSELLFGKIPSPAGGTVNLLPDTSLMKRYFTPKINFADGVGALLKGI